MALALMSRLSPPLTFFDTDWFNYLLAESFYFYHHPDINHELFNSQIFSKLKTASSLSLATLSGPRLMLQSPSSATLQPIAFPLQLRCIMTTSTITAGTQPMKPSSYIHSVAETGRRQFAPSQILEKKLIIPISTVEYMY